MNTVRSVGYGWAALIVAGGGAYYFAKRSIDADRASRADSERRKRAMQRDLESSYLSGTPVESPALSQRGSNGNGNGVDDVAASPSTEASRDPAATRHAPETKGQQVVEKSKFEATEPWRSRKGDRFS